ncbi:MAG: polysaccharide biosynthesis tyrosine autokinase [Gemmatirosa sp.]
MSNTSLSSTQQSSSQTSLTSGEGSRGLVGGSIPPSPPPLLNLMDVGRAVRRRWLAASVCFLVITGLAVAMTMMREPRYTATAVLRVVDLRHELAGDLVNQQRVVSLPNADPVLTQTQVLLSRATARRAIGAPGGALLRLHAVAFPLECIQTADAGPAGDSVSLRFGADRVSGTRGTEQATAAYGTPLRLGDLTLVVGCRPPVEGGVLHLASLESATGSIMRGVTARPRQGTDVVDVTFSALDPSIAQRGVNMLVSSFQEMNLESSRRRSRQRLEFVQQQLVISEARFRSAREQLAAFRSRTPLLGAMRAAGGGVGTSGTLPVLATDRLQSEREVIAATALLARLEDGRDRSVSELVITVADAGSLGPAAGQFVDQLMRLARSRDSLVNIGMGLTPSHRTIVQLDAHLGEVRERLVAALRDRVTSQQRRLASLEEEQARELRITSSLPFAQAEESRLMAQERVEQRLVEQLRGEQQRAHIAVAAEGGEVDVVDLATRASTASWPLDSHIIVFGAGLGLLVGAAAAYGREQLDTSVRRRRDLEDVLAVPGIVVIPRLSSTSERTRLARLTDRVRRPPRAIDPAPTAVVDGPADATLAALVTLGDHQRTDETMAIPTGPWLREAQARDTQRRGQVHGPNGPLASGAFAAGARDTRSETTGTLRTEAWGQSTDEAFRHLRTGLLFASVDGAPRTLAVTSALAGEGKTTVAVNLAISLAESSARVLLVDGDIRNPQIHKELGGPMSPGLVDAVHGDWPMGGMIRSTAIPGLSILPAGRARSARGELLPGATLRRLLAEATQRFDVVIVDAPPVLPSATASVIGAVCDGVLFVVRAGRTEQAVGRDALDRLRRVGARVVGAVLNDPDGAAIEQSEAYYAYAPSEESRVN